MKTDRTTPIAFQTISKVAIPKWQKLVLNNGVDLYYINSGNSGVLKLDIVFNAGVDKQKQKSIAKAVSSMLLSGTNSRNSAQIATGLDYWGAYLQAHCYPDDAVLTLFSLSKNTKNCLPFISDILTNSAFPETELETYKRNAVQKLLENEKKNRFLARRLFYSSVFGNESKYGSFSLSSNYINISRENLLSFYKDNYFGGIKYIIASGNTNKLTLDRLFCFFSTLHHHKTMVSPGLKGLGDKPKRLVLDKPESNQTTIRIGYKTINRAHVDFLGLQLLNLVLGGYFGSRLTKVIREEKGLTYGIYSSLESFTDCGCFSIETEINSAATLICEEEIYKEIQRLRSVLISKEELDRAKRYFSGLIIRSLDGPFSISERLKTIIDWDYSNNYYGSILERIALYTSEDLMVLAVKYLNPKLFTTVIVGKKT